MPQLQPQGHSQKFLTGEIIFLLQLPICSEKNIDSSFIYVKNTNMHSLQNRSICLWCRNPKGAKNDVFWSVLMFCVKNWLF